jgi:hypothetical protein
MIETYFKCSRSQNAKVSLKQIPVSLTRRNCGPVLSKKYQEEAGRQLLSSRPGGRYMGARTSDCPISMTIKHCS